MRVASVHAAAIALLTTCVAANAAQSPSVEALAEQLQKLQDTLTKQQELLQAQAAEIERLREQINVTKLTAQDTPKVAMSGARPTITTADGRNSFAPRAVVQLDIADHREDDAGPLTTDFRRGSIGGGGSRDANGARDFADGAYFRRARLGIEGTIARDFNYRLMLELGGSGSEGPTRINDAYIAYTGFAPFTVQLGAFSPPANMDDGISVAGSLFIERATPSEISRTLGGADGRIGLGIRGSGQRWMGALTLTTRTVSDAEVFDSQLATVARLGGLIARGSDYNLHAGVSGTWVFAPADQGFGATGERTPIRFRDRPEIRVDSTRLIDTGTIDADSAYVAGLELGANWKSFYLQGENFWYGIARPEASPLSDPSFGGYYVQGSWIITGESRRYDPASGAFQAPRPFVPFTAYGGTGAWELALRYSHMDLNYHEGPAGLASPVDGVRGGEQSIWTLGLSWYMNPSVRLLFNYYRIDVDRLNPASLANPLPFGPAPLTPPIGVQIGQDLDIFAIRSQFSF